MTAVAERAPQSIYARPTATTGWRSWLVTVDHKKVGILYFCTAVFFFFVGGVEAGLIRAQLSGPNATVLTADQYNQVFTMHGITMIFFGLMPLAVAFTNYLLPLMIGARDVAFPRLNALSYWVFLFAGLFTYSSLLFGGMPDGAWVAYAPLNSTVGPDPLGYTLSSGPTTESMRMIFYSLGLQIAGVASLAGAINFIVTTLNMRAPGMTLMRMPAFVWMMLVVSFLLLFAMPVIGVALWQLMFDTAFNANFFNPSTGADPVLWQHMFWLFGHPEVYILILPAFGIISEILPTFSRKPLFGYAAIVFAGIAIGFIGWGVWAHHMFTSGLGPVANSAFALSTMIIAVPTGVKIFNWVATIWGGRIELKTPMLFAIGAVAMFTIGGLSGVTHAAVPHDYQQHDTYYVVAHFHYVLFGGGVFGLVAGAYYWFPKATGRYLNERLGQVHFWLMLVGFNLVFAPMHLLGLNGMPRRINTYPEGMGWDFWNIVVTVGYVFLLVGFSEFLYNMVISARKGERAGPDPWDGRTVEWLTTSPPAEHNFDEIPLVTTRDELWHRKYLTTEEHARPVPSGGAVEAAPPAQTTDHGAAHTAEIHLPGPSFYPLIVALGMPVMAYGVLFAGLRIPLIVLGAVIMFTGIFGWVLEPSEEHGAAEAH